MNKRKKVALKKHRVKAKKQEEKRRGVYTCPATLSEAQMAGEPPSLLLAIVDDLMVKSRIDAAAEIAGVEVRYVRSFADVRAAAGDVEPRAILVGMAATRRPWAAIVEEVRADPATRELYVLAFGPHKNLELRAKALEAGVDRVVANSAFTRLLPTLLTTPTAPAPDDDEV